MNETSSVPSIAARVVLKPRKALPFYGRHPWVLASAVDRVEPVSIESEHLLDLDGQEVELQNEKRKFIARGFFNSQSRIRVRLYTWSPDEPLDEAFFRQKIEASIELRRQIGYEPSVGADNPVCQATRLVFSEADNLSGLIVDRYGDALVIQPTALAIVQRMDMIEGILRDLVRPQAIVVKMERAMAKLEGIPVEGGDHPHPHPLPKGEGTAEPLIIREHTIDYELDLSTGQKTGLYLDQRENRLAAAKYVAGRRVLDMFCYTGGFSLTAAKLGDARDVLGIDGSKRAIAQAQRNAEINSIQNVRFEAADAFKKLDALQAVGDKFDAVILDPPKFARGRGGANAALMAYHRLNRAAVELLNPGGILITCSCTGGVSREDFMRMLSGVAQKSRRQIRILEQRGAAPDHPVSATCLETDYLKCIICEIR